MAASKAQKKNREAGKYSGPAKRQLALVGVAGLFLVVWGFVLGILVGRGMVPTLVEPKPRPAPVTVTPDGRGEPGRSGKIVAARADRSDNGSAGSDSTEAGSTKPLNQSNLEFFDQLAKVDDNRSPATGDYDYDHDHDRRTGCQGDNHDDHGQGDPGDKETRQKGRGKNPPRPRPPRRQSPRATTPSRRPLSGAGPMQPSTPPG